MTAASARASRVEPGAVTEVAQNSSSNSRIRQHQPVACVCICCADQSSTRGRARGMSASEELASGFDPKRRFTQLVKDVGAANRSKGDSRQ